MEVAMPESSKRLEHDEISLRVEEIGDGKRRLTVAPKGDTFIPYRTWDTAYPLDLISLILEHKGAWVLDEIKRDEDSQYVGHEVKWEVLSYLNDSRLDDCDLLDFGSGSGASSMVISRIAPTARITGVELEPAFVDIARRRAEFYNVQDRVRFLLSPTPRKLPDNLPQFNYIFLSAVYEHLLPAERRHLLPMLWSRLKPGGVMFLNQTPHRWFPIEHHTTGLPLINYLPDFLTGAIARKCSRKLRGDESWEELLRKGIRGATAEDIIGVLNTEGRKAQSLTPCRFGAADHFDVWYQYSNTLEPSPLRKLAKWGFRYIHRVTRLTFVPYISLAIEKIV
jgi:2-polyprenyl-3-methyl-5-hydroxy-6-metoxy-1,4-benzoquinol methylase